MPEKNILRWISSGTAWLTALIAFITCWIAGANGVLGHFAFVIISILIYGYLGFAIFKGKFAGKHVAAIIFIICSIVLFVLPLLSIIGTTGRLAENKLSNLGTELTVVFVSFSWILALILSAIGLAFNRTKKTT